MEGYRAAKTLVQLGVRIKMTHRLNNSSGFTLIEMMIALAVGGIVLAGLAITFTKQSDSKLQQEDVTEILQNSRVVRMLIADDLRMAGYYDSSVASSPNNLALYNSQNGSANPSVSGLSANALTVRYWDDTPTYGTPGIKTVDYRLRDGVDADTLVDDLGWTNSNLGPWQARDLIGDVDGLEFLYTINDGTTAVNTKVATPTAAQVKDIKAVTVTMLLRGKFARTGMVDTKTYRTPFGTVWGPFDDRFKRRLTSFTVSCRNMEL